MNGGDPQASIMDKLLELERRILAIENIVIPHDSIPWTVIAAAVAAALPDAQIISVRPSVQTADIFLQKLWSIEGRMRQFDSHKVRN